LQTLPDGWPAVQVPPVEGHVLTQAVFPFTPPDVQALKLTHEGVVPPEDTYPPPQVQVQPPVPTTVQLELASPPALHGFAPTRHWLTQVVPLKVKPVSQPQE
jgi:hypothetical protein